MREPWCHIEQPGQRKEIGRLALCADSRLSLWFLSRCCAMFRGFRSAFGVGSTDEGGHILTEVVLICASYVLGAVNGAYYLVRIRIGRDIRTIGSGTAGARNAGRALGKWGFVAVLCWDAVKGFAVVMLAKDLGVAPGVIGAAAVAVVAGHIWPPQLRFRGGKGFATSLGSLVALGYALIVGPVLVLVPGYILVRQVSMAGLMAFASAPVFALWWRGWGIEVVTSTALVALVLFAHRGDITDYLQAGRWSEARSSVNP